MLVPDPRSTTSTAESPAPMVVRTHEPRQQGASRQGPGRIVGLDPQLEPTGVGCGPGAAGGGVPGRYRRPSTKRSDGRNRSRRLSLTRCSSLRSAPPPAGAPNPHDQRRREVSLNSRTEASLGLGDCRAGGRQLDVRQRRWLVPRAHPPPITSSPMPPRTRRRPGSVWCFACQSHRQLEPGGVVTRRLATASLPG